ncbi:hypothetical protein SLEP1_g46664 [Rubroshorea leprosula]|uniref:Uncharacterized protein n=1 Tax=Rubroshorea leprosula TaxID=152421 RepID=A0AAV5LN07_9ROSI|nr:hypothetical protein SLEP1_g46664 [Rubroshorea leprosula]
MKREVPAEVRNGSFWALQRKGKKAKASFEPMASSLSTQSSIPLAYFEDKSNLEWDYGGPDRSCKCGIFTPG